jgi:hypothetical protein
MVTTPVGDPATNPIRRGYYVGRCTLDSLINAFINWMTGVEAFPFVR